MTKDSDSYFMPCPNCKGISIVRGGTYLTENKEKRQRLKCKTCKKTYTFDPTYKRISEDIREKILKLYKTKKKHKNKFDCMKKDTYSTREVSKKLNVSKSFVHTVVKGDKNEK